MSRELKEAIAATVGLVAAAWIAVALFATFPLWGPVVGLWLLWREWRG